MINPKRILIVDDENEFSELLKDALELRGFEVDTAVNAVEAGMSLAIKPPALIIMDIRMPGIDGLQACQAIKKNPNTKNIPVIIITGLQEEVYKKKALKLGIRDYLVKPVDVEALIAKIGKILQQA